MKGLIKLSLLGLLLTACVVWAGAALWPQWANTLAEGFVAPELFSANDRDYTENWTDTLTFADGTVQVKSRSAALSDRLTLQQTVYALQNGDQVLFGAAQTGETSGSEKQTVQEFSCLAGSTVRWYDTDTQSWHKSAFFTSFTRVFHAGLLEIAGENTHILIYKPRGYRLLSAGNREALSDADGCIRIRRVGSRLNITVESGALPAGASADYICVVSGEEALIDWTHPNAESLWSSYTLDGDGKWCIDGYYWPSPDSYDPTGENVYFRCMAAYLLRSFIEVSKAHRVASDLALAMADTLAREQNESGYWPTTATSLWLSKEYQISSGFYDTRFNSELVGMLLDVQAQHGGTGFTAPLMEYASFYLNTAEKNHLTTKNGWMVCDYWNKAGGKQTHSSLNHQIAELLLLYRLRDFAENQPDTQAMTARMDALAEKMLTGILDIGTKWLQADGAFFYAYYPDGTMGGLDYPYLTYNDLYDLQNKLLLDTGATNAVLTTLMDRKRQSMDAQGITGYKGWQAQE